MKNRIIIFGSTGRIGIQALEVIAQYPHDFELVGISGHSNLVLLEKQIATYHPRYVALSSNTSRDKLRALFPKTTFFDGPEALIHLASVPEATMACISIVGVAALLPTLKAIETGKDIALASKEVLVAAGGIVYQALRRYKKKLFPIDSEHAAIDLCLKGFSKKSVERIILTASGGPFLHQKDLSKITLTDALAHPNWTMGKKITIDSATLINKGLEVMEAHWLFKMPYERIHVVVHPQSIVHGLVELINGAMIAQMGQPDMKMPILYALSRGSILPFMKHPLHLENSKLEFMEPDLTRFKGLALAYEVGKKGGSWPVVFNAANEEAVHLFIHEKIGFTDIVPYIETCLHRHHATKAPSLPTILELDKWARLTIHEQYHQKR